MGAQKLEYRAFFCITREYSFHFGEEERELWAWTHHAHVL